MCAGENGLAMLLSSSWYLKEDSCENLYRVTSYRSHCITHELDQNLKSMVNCTEEHAPLPSG